jgi:hypothetical protein
MCECYSPALREAKSFSQTNDRLPKSHPAGHHHYFATQQLTLPK